MENCVFCKIIKGEIPSKKVYEDDLMLVIHDNCPVAPCHVLILPKIHMANILTADRDFIAHVTDKLGELTKLLGVTEDGFRLVINTGKDGGQTVDHLHLHLLGGAPLGWPPC
ncbi:MAG TPA: histidine triad nucleotide-binding protein [Candidatus Avacidaminococcus intestinavium]|uniref:Histidine triad nucleotide-binding protein n=1 Tax=Candidatus Avacidaminococcus intestinavium TaxID=2840684 RepID=A0A9D1SK54_9FIRM|nr:histidine triad nucleotide-binding protein [Candidatus Avacidaminococcus intestinavium]